MSLKTEEEEASEIDEKESELEEESELSVKASTHEVDTKEVGPVAYRMRPSLADIFKVKPIKEIIQTVLTKTLQGKKYNVEDARKWTTDIADTVGSMVKDLNMPRYKHVVQISLGQQLGAGCRYIAKCSWDAESDSYTSDVFTNASLFCVCTVFGIYVY